MPNSLLRIRIASLVLPLVVACGGSVFEPPPVADGGTRRDTGHGGPERERGNETTPGVDARPQDDFPVFHEDACPDAPMEPPPLECDPFNQSTCPPHQGCYPIPPRATDHCHPGSYSTLCLPSGPGAQGFPCGDGTDCIAGFICVKSGQGDECVKLCRTTDVSACIDGRVCREVDVTGSGWGGCE